MKDWGEVSEIYEDINKEAFEKNLENESEAQTRFDVIDRLIKEVLQWSHGQISVEPPTDGKRKGYIDYVLNAVNIKIIIEAKKTGATFPSPTKKRKLKLTGTILGQGEIASAIEQAEDYAQNENADFVVVTNGNCWCLFPKLEDRERNSIYATVLFPFENVEDAEHLYNLLSCNNVESNSLKEFDINSNVEVVNKIYKILDNADAKIGRNSIADFIMPAIETALISESLLENKEALEKCYVTTENRTKYDNTLNMNLNGYKPEIISPAKKIKKSKQKDELSKQIEISTNGIAPPVTLIIGSVGSGKSTYLKHFELIKGKDILNKKNAHWIYIDLEKLGKTGNPRDFIYNEILKYLNQEHPENPTDYKSLVEPAYEEEVRSLARGVYGRLFSKDKAQFDKKIDELIDKEYKEVEPYVDRMLSYLVKEHLCVIAIDNVDLYEDENLETTVFSEAISISKKNKCNILVSIRDSTYIKHRNDSIFNAYQLKRFWIEAPSFKEVLSKRLIYAKKVLEGKSAEIILSNSAILKVDDLSIFFDIVQKSLLNEQNGQFLEYLSDRNPRKGISYVYSFLTSAHIQADKAIQNYVQGETTFVFPYHEVFKGCMLSQWRYYREKHSDALNIFDSNIPSKNLQLIRLNILNLLYMFSQSENTVEVDKNIIVETISQFGVSEDKITETINELKSYSLLSSNNEHVSNASYSLTLTGGYYIKILCRKMIYVESVLHDTNILDTEFFNIMSRQTNAIEHEYNLSNRMSLRKDRIEMFINYLKEVESCSIDGKSLNQFEIMDSIREDVMRDCYTAIAKARKYH